ncbi:MAG TPA: hypothetical protein VMA83_05435 [Solirubrobacteraceae bacterium]|nr:hypothetical protein [Solirubrobacteraceae bacterium]
MLFDLRGAGRRRTVRIVYVGLAILIGGGLVFLGVGGGVGGAGLLTAATENKNSGNKTFEAEVKKYREQTKKEPTNAAAWERYTKALLHEASGEAFHTTNGQTSALTSRGTEVYSEAGAAWERYVALEPHHPNPELAELMVRIYDEEGLSKPAKVVEALQLVIASRPESAALYGQLAEYAYKAGNAHTGDLAARKAVELTPAASRESVRRTLETAKKEIENEAKKAAGSGTSTTPSSGG